MLGSIILTVPLLAAGAVARGPWHNWPGPYPNNCLNDTTVQNLLTGYTYLLENPQGANFVSTANAILSDSFFVSSDSINTLAQIPVCPTSVTSKILY